MIDLHWLPIEFRCQFKILVYAYEALHGQAPIYISELIVPYTPSRSLRSESSNILVIPSTRTVKYGNRRFDKAASTLIEIFKKNLITFLIKKTYDLWMYLILLLCFLSMHGRLVHSDTWHIFIFQFQACRWLLFFHVDFTVLYNNVVQSLRV